MCSAHRHRLWIKGAPRDAHKSYSAAGRRPGTGPPGPLAGSSYGQLNTAGQAGFQSTSLLQHDRALLFECDQSLGQSCNSLQLSPYIFHHPPYHIPPNTLGVPTPPALTLLTPKTAIERHGVLLTTSTRAVAGWLEIWMWTRFICCTSLAPYPFPLHLGQKGSNLRPAPFRTFVSKLSSRTMDR